MTAPRDLAFHAAVLNELHARVTFAKDATRAELQEAMVGQSIKSLTVLGGGEDIGTATLVKGRVTVSARISDPDALLAWAQEHHPDEVETVTRLRPGFEARVLQQSKAAEQPCMDGVLDVPGVDVQVSTGEPYVRLKPTDAAPEVVARLWSQGAIDLPLLLELAGGE